MRMGTPAQKIAVEQMYVEHDGKLRRFLARMLGCEEAAAEVAQEVYLRLLRFAPRRDMDDPRAYLFTVAANAARDRLARERTRNGVIDIRPLPDAVTCQRPDAEVTAAERERLRILSGAVDALPARCRQVFLMSRIDGASNTEIARTLGISRNMVEKHIIKAMLRCRRTLEAAGE